MKAAFCGSNGEFEISEYQPPKPGRGEVLLEVAYCGICGSDIHMVAFGLFPPGSIIGHEVSGSVAEAGEGVENWRKGDRAVVLPFDYCSSCEMCRIGNNQLCVETISRSYGLGNTPGGFSQFMLVKSSMLYRVPEGLDLKSAALNEPWSVAWHGVNLLNFQPPAPVLVMGAGPIGLMSIYGLKSRGAENIFVSEPNSYRAEKAKAAGAKMVIDPTVTQPASVILEQSGRAPVGVIDCAGSESSLQDAVIAAGPRGQVVVLGLHMNNVYLTPLVCFGKEIQINFSLGYNHKDFGEALQRLAQGAVNPDVVISDVVPLKEITQAFQMLQKANHAKILIDCRQA